MFLDKIDLSPFTKLLSFLSPISPPPPKTHLIASLGINMVKGWILMGFWGTGIEWVLDLVFIFYYFLNLFVGWILFLEREEKKN